MLEKIFSKFLEEYEGLAVLVRFAYYLKTIEPDKSKQNLNSTISKELLKKVWGNIEAYEFVKQSIKGFNEQIKKITKESNNEQQSSQYQQSSPSNSINDYLEQVLNNEFIELPLASSSNSSQNNHQTNDNISLSKVSIYNSRIKKRNYQSNNNNINVSSSENDDYFRPMINQPNYKISSSRSHKRRKSDNLQSSNYSTSSSLSHDNSLVTITETIEMISSTSPRDSSSTSPRDSSSTSPRDSSSIPEIVEMGSSSFSLDNSLVEVPKTTEIISIDENIILVNSVLEDLAEPSWIDIATRIQTHNAAECSKQWKYLINQLYN
ncbi:9478_t:CDS:2 [Ambispora gerdemannii]|uniref:9478_t:CDS:1 n=1 Tax=Ambispora gerdemannii TaxID=144530 RepID=A0A9N9BNL9_9GLOM|nr:9478_t:CDS:2 [Ambispora gerdemannii]